MNKMIMKIAKTTWIFCVGFFWSVLAGCSSDEPQLSNGMYEYSVEQLQEIYQLQEDYEVSFDFPTSSDNKLPTVKEMEELCLFVASINSTKKTVEKQGNTFRITPKNTLKTRAYSGNAKESVNVITYSGSITSKGQIVDKSYSCSFDYEVRWSCVGDREHESVTGSVNSIDAPSGWYIYKTGFSYLAGDPQIRKEKFSVRKNGISTPNRHTGSLQHPNKA